MRSKLQRTAAGLIAAVLLFCTLPVWAASWGTQTGQITVEFDANGGRGQLPAPLSGTQGAQLTLPDTRLGSPQDTQGLHFAGWSVRPGAEQPDYQPGDTISLTRDSTLYAVFSREPSTFSKRPVESPASPSGNPAFTLRTEVHQKYMDGGADGLFHPAQSLTRAELAQMLYQIVVDRPAAGAAFSDVAPEAWYAPAVGAIAGLDILRGYPDGSFRPDQPVTRAEAAAALAQLTSAPGNASFADVPAGHPYYAAISAAGACGLFSGDADGNFNPDAPLLRSEAAVVFNKLTGRSPDLDALRANPNIRFFPDVPTTHWAYAQIMEAAVSHDHIQGKNGTESWRNIQSEPTVLTDGFHRINGWLYCVSGGYFLRSTSSGYFTFDGEGRYTTGDSALDQQLNALVDSLTNDSMDRDAKLRALFNYVRDHFTYLKRPLIEKGQTGWEPEYASAFLRMGKGNCFSFSALYCLLAREVGQPAYTVVGGLGKNANPHGWVEIELDGVTYMFDTQLEWRYLHDYGRKGYDLFKFRPEKARFIYTR